jgi:prophage antirepressor-like protein
MAAPVYNPENRQLFVGDAAAPVYDTENRLIRLGDAAARVHIRTVGGLPQPWFQAKPIVQHLGYTSNNVANALKKVHEKYRKSLGELVGVDCETQSTLGHHDSIATYLSEPGLFELLCKSEMPAARPFQDWLFEEVLPKVRREGSYSLVPRPTEQAVAHAVEQAVERMLPQLADRLAERVLPQVLEAILAAAPSHHILELNNGGASDEDQARLRAIGRNTALAFEEYMAEGPLSLGAFLRQQLPLDEHWKVAKLKPKFAAEAKSRRIARYEADGMRPWLVYSQGALRIAYTEADYEALLLQFQEPETQASLVRLQPSIRPRAGQPTRLVRGPYDRGGRPLTQVDINSFFDRCRR